MYICIQICMYIHIYIYKYLRISVYIDMYGCTHEDCVDVWTFWKCLKMVGPDKRWFPNGFDQFWMILGSIIGTDSHVCLYVCKSLLIDDYLCMHVYLHIGSGRTGLSCFSPKWGKHTEVLFFFFTSSRINSSDPHISITSRLSLTIPEYMWLNLNIVWLKTGLLLTFAFLFVKNGQIPTCLSTLSTGILVTRLKSFPAELPTERRVQFHPLRFAGNLYIQQTSSRPFQSIDPIQSIPDSFF